MFAFQLTTSNGAVISQTACALPLNTDQGLFALNSLVEGAVCLADYPAILPTQKVLETTEGLSDSLYKALTKTDAGYMVSVEYRGHVIQVNMVEKQI